jgi:prolyl-tRNA synthetase
MLEDFFHLPPDAFLKTVVYSADGKLVVAVIRGDLDVNEIKLANCLHVPEVRLATDEELQAASIIPGFVSPVGLSGVQIVVDDAVGERSYVAGANQADKHLRNVVPGRDFPLDHVTDIALAVAGGACRRCGGELAGERGLEIGHVFKLGTKYSAPMHADYLGADGRESPVVMGCYGIGLDRLLTAIVEANRDEKGIVWPLSVAPYHVHLLALNLDQPGVADVAEELYDGLSNRGVEVLFDDRVESPGVKFADADLIGLPLRVTVSQRSLKQASVELTPRRTRQSTLAPLADAVNAIVGHEALRP